MNPIKNKGMYLEEIINITNEKYLYNKVCCVAKIPTNIKPIHTNIAHNIDYAKFMKGDSCDYIGCYQGTYFEFDAKETSRTSFSFNNIRANQVKKLNEVILAKGLAFLIIYFSKYDKYYLANWSSLNFYFNEYKKSIPFEWFQDNAIELFINSNLTLDYVSKLHLITIN